MKTNTILDNIFARKRAEVNAIPPLIKAAYANATPTQPIFRNALIAPVPTESLHLIAEFKRASPSKGAIYPNALVSDIIPLYRRDGATAISVLTDSGFGGSLEDLAAARALTTRPILRKDFIFSKTQVEQARTYGADAILLIASYLNTHELEVLREHAETYGMDALVEVHTRDDLQRALDSGAHIIGINNRDLRTFQTRLETTLELLHYIPSDIPVVTESGIHTYADVQQLSVPPVCAMLVGESLMSKKPLEGITQQIKELYGQK